MRNKFFGSLGIFLVLCLCFVWAAPSAQAAETTYVVSFRPGENGRFDQGAVDYLSAFGNVQMTSAGNIFLEVRSGTRFPGGIVNYLAADEGYYYRSGLAGGTINGDATYVAQYGILSGEGVRYTVKYVDSVSGSEVAESYTGYANAGDEITFAAKVVSGYDVDSASKSLTVTEGGELTFLYTSNGSEDEIRYVYEPDTIIQNNPVQDVDNDNNNDDNAGNAGGNAQNAGDNAETTAPQEEIGENDVPLGGGSTDGQTAPVEDIDDNDTPLAPGVPGEPDKGGNGLMIGLSVGILALLAVAAAVVVSKKRR